MDKEIMNLHLQGKTRQEISSILSLPLKAVQSILDRKLNRCLHPDAEVSAYGWCPDCGKALTSNGLV